MRRLAVSFTLFLSIIFIGTPARAQSSSWDAGLDSFEMICHKCIGLKERIAAGERVQSDSLSVVLDQVSALRERLQAVSGEMNPVQKRRLQCIKDMYRSGDVFSTASWIQLPEASGIPMSITPVYAAPFSPNPVSYVTQRKTGFSPFITAGVLPEFHVGLGARYRPGCGPWGMYVKGASSFAFRKPGYTCLSDGTVDDGSALWVSGRKSISFLSVTAGVHYSLTPQWGGFAGAGWAFRKLYWEDSFSNWVEVSDRSYTGVALEAGVSFKPFENIGFLGGVTAIPFGYASVFFGLSYDL